MFSVKTKNLRAQKIIAGVLIGAVLFTGSAAPARADFWGAALISTFMHRALDSIWENIQAMMLGIAKRVAIGLARDVANRLTAGGSSKKATFITDYKEYIFGIALDEGMIYMNDLLTTATGGKNSALNYIVAGGSLQALGMNYMGYLNAEVQAAFQQDRCRFNLDQYTKDVTLSLGEGDWRVFSAVVSNNCNNPRGLSLEIREATQKKISQQQEINKVKAIAGQGFKGVEINGKTVTPGSVIQGVTTNVQNLAVNMIPAAGKWQELVAAAAGAFANQALNNLYQRGFELVAKNLSRELGKVDSKIREARTGLQQQLGPGSQFLRNSNQQLGGYSSQTGKYTGVQQSLVNFNTTPNCTVDQGC